MPKTGARSLAADTVSAVVEGAESFPCADETEAPCASTMQAPRGDHMSCTRQPREETTDARSYASAAQYPAGNQAGQTADAMNVLADTTSYNAYNAPANETAPERLKGAVPQRLVPQNATEVGEHVRGDHMSGSKHPREQFHEHLRTAMTESPRLPAHARAMPPCAIPEPVSSRRKASNTQLQRITSSDSAAPVGLVNRVLSSSRLNPRGEGRGDVLSPRETAREAAAGLQAQAVPDGTSTNVANSVVGMAEPRPNSPDNRSHAADDRSHGSQGAQSVAAHRAPADTVHEAGQVDAAAAPTPLSDNAKSEAGMKPEPSHPLPDLVSTNVANSVVGMAEPRCISADNQSHATKSVAGHRVDAVDHTETHRQGQQPAPKPHNNTVEDRSGPAAAPSTIGIAAGSMQEMRAPTCAVPSESDYTGTACDTNPTTAPSHTPAGARPPKPPTLHAPACRPIVTTNLTAAQQISSPVFSMDNSMVNGTAHPGAAPETEVPPAAAARRVTRSVTASRSTTQGGSRRKRTDSAAPAKTKRPKN